MMATFSPDGLVFIFMLSYGHICKQQQTRSSPRYFTDETRHVINAQ